MAKKTKTARAVRLAIIPFPGPVKSREVMLDEALALLRATPTDVLEAYLPVFVKHTYSRGF